MSNFFKRLLLDIIGLLFCFSPMAIVTFQCAPNWNNSVGFIPASGGIIATLTIMALIVLTKYAKVRIRTPSPVFIFLIIYGFLLFIEKVVTDLKIIMLWGVIGSAIGAIFFMWADKYKAGKSE